MEVVNTIGQISQFQPKIIKEHILYETELDEEHAERIKVRIAKLINKLPCQQISTAQIRDMVNYHLTKDEMFEDEKKSRKLGMSVKAFEDLIECGCQDNANIGYSPEMIAKYAYDSIGKEYALLTMPEECADAHTNGYIHIHDQEYYNTRPNCFVYDIRFFARNGLNIDGRGLMGSLANPATTLEVLLNHLLQAVMSGAQCLSGGQAFAFFNIFLAPYAKGMTYKEIKQAIQGFIFNANMSLVSRGGQVLFSSINVEFSVPEFLKDVPAVGPNGLEVGTYADYENEAELILTAIIEVLTEGDSKGRPHRFPNTIFMIREGTLDKYEGNVAKVHELVVKFPTIYFGNCMPGKTTNRTYMGCRTQARTDWTGDWETDTLNFGNFMYCTINLPLIAIESNNTQEFYDTLSKYMKICKKSLLDRKEKIEDILYNKHMSDFLLQKDKNTGEPLYQLDKNSFSIGFCGLYECLEELKQKGINESGEDIVSFMYSTIQEYKKDGLRWSLFATPAESTAHRFAEINKKKYPNAIVQGTKDHYYLTNSHHIPVGNENLLIDHIKNADKYHEMCGAGAILHLWLGEVRPDPESLWKLNKKIAQTNTAFWAYSTVFSSCNDCGYTINDAIDECLVCKSNDVTQYDRVTGYYLPVNGFNNGKKQEFKDRYRHSLE